MKVERCTYMIQTNQVKSNGENLNQKDLINLGYLAGRCGINLNGNPNEINKPDFTQEGVKLDINCCTCKMFEENLNKSGIKFDVVV